MEIWLAETDRDGAYQALQTCERGDRVPFVLLDALDRRRYALNVDELVIWSFDECSGSLEHAQSNDVRLLDAGGHQIAFEVAADEPNDWDDVGYLNYCFYMLDTFVERHASVPLEASNGSRWFFTAGAVAALSAPIGMIGLEQPADR